MSNVPENNLRTECHEAVRARTEGYEAVRTPPEGHTAVRGDAALVSVWGEGRLQGRGVQNETGRPENTRMALDSTANKDLPRRVTQKSWVNISLSGNDSELNLPRSE